MLIRIERQPPHPSATLGALLIDGRACLFTREDPIRSDHVFIPGQAALPAGLYNLRYERSRRFGLDLPCIISTEPSVERRRGSNRVGMFFHPGEPELDLGGEILLGLAIEGLSLRQTAAGFRTLSGIIRAATDRGEAVEVEIT